MIYVLNVNKKVMKRLNYFIFRQHDTTILNKKAILSELFWKYR